MMPDFQPRDAQFKARITESFDIQPFAGFIGAELVHVAPGAVDIALPFKPELTQQAGYVHGGVLTTIADAAAGGPARRASSAIPSASTVIVSTNWRETISLTFV